MKRKTKAQREAEQRAALFVRVRDIYSGACGTSWDEDLHEEQGEWLNMETAERVVQALRWTFRGKRDEGADKHQLDWIFDSHVLSKFESATSATDWLFEHGVRA